MTHAEQAAPSGIEVREQLEYELLDAAERHRGLVEATAAALETRDRLIVRLIDAGMAQTTVAEVAGVSRATVNRAWCNPDY